MSTIEAWHDRVRGSLSGYTELEITAIAQNCYVAERVGENAAVWHECQCVPCRSVVAGCVNPR